MFVTEGEALSAAAFDALMRDFAVPPGAVSGLAVSGGPDSMALAILTKRWCERHGYAPPIAFIVDHALRTESAAESATVKTRLEQLGLHAEILRWDHPLVTSRLHGQARKARYRLLLDACRRHGIANLLFAHQCEDQAETILMRLAKGSGIDGLAGMRRESVMQGVRILRPLLDVSKTNLIATCNDAAISFVTDPSNVLPKFARGRLRAVMPLLAEEGLTVDRLIDCGIRAAEARDALEQITAEFLQKASQQDAYGVVRIDKASLLTQPRAIALRSLGALLQRVHNCDYDPTHASLSGLLDGLMRQDVMPPRSLHGCLIGQNKNHVTIFREFSAISDSVPIHAGETVVWDGRWQVTLCAEAGAGPYAVRALGNAPHKILDLLSADLRRQVQQGRIRAALPSIWRGHELAFIPFSDKRALSSAILSPIQRN